MHWNYFHNALYLKALSKVLFSTDIFLQYNHAQIEQQNKHGFNY